jgi:hypothetical protein
MMSRQVLYNHTAINTNYKVEPGLNGQLCILVPQDLEAKGTMVRALGRGIRVKAGNKTVQSIEHDYGSLAIISVHWSDLTMDCARYFVNRGKLYSGSSKLA